jgi:hypothetical protein
MFKKGKLAVLALVTMSTLLASGCGVIHQVLTHWNDFSQLGAAWKVLTSTKL